LTFLSILFEYILKVVSFIISKAIRRLKLIVPLLLYILQIKKVK